MYQMFEVLKSIIFGSENNITSLSYVHAKINNNSSNRKLICVLSVIFMFNHFQYNILMYDENISKGHKCGNNFCPPLSIPMVHFNIVVHGESFKTE